MVARLTARYRLATALVGLTVAAVGCIPITREIGPTPRPRLEAVLSTPDGAPWGTVIAEALGADRVGISGNLGGGLEWGVTIRDGSCDAPGTTLFIVGPIEHDQLDHVIEVDPPTLVGRIVAVSPLVSPSDVTACGTLLLP